MRFDSNCPHRDTSRWKEVRTLKENNYRKWMIVIAVATLIVTVIRLWIGG